MKSPTLVESLKKTFYIISNVLILEKKNPRLLSTFPILIHWLLQKEKNLNHLILVMLHIHHLDQIFTILEFILKQN